MTVISISSSSLTARQDAIQSSGETIVRPSWPLSAVHAFNREAVTEAKVQIFGRARCAGLAPITRLPASQHSTSDLYFILCITALHFPPCVHPCIRNRLRGLLCTLFSITVAEP